jgi:hypothetical protein
MDIFNVQALIREGKLVGASDIDPTSSYLQVGVFQNGNRRAGASNADTYPSYAIPISEIAGNSVSNKSVIVVDAVYGDDASAVAAGIYDFNKPFQTIDAAIANAAYGDTLWLLTSYGKNYDYTINENLLLDLGLTIYAWNCILTFASSLLSTGITSTLTIKGNATIIFGDTGEPTINTSLSTSVNINIECANFLVLPSTTIGFNPLYLNSADPAEECFFTLKADYMTYDSAIFFLAATNFSVNIDVTTLERNAISLGIPTGDFWFNDLNGASNVYSVSRLNFGSARLKQQEGTNLINISNGKYNTVYLTGNIKSTGLSNFVSLPTAIVLQDNSPTYTYIDANMSLDNVGAYVSRTNTSKAVIKGSINHANANTTPFSSCIYIDKGQVKLYAEIYAVSRNIIYFPATATAGLSGIDINNCKLVNTLGQILNNVGGAPTIRLYNATFIATAVTNSATSTVALPVQIYSLYTNKAMDPINITQALTAGTVEGQMVDIAMTAVSW